MARTCRHLDLDERRTLFRLIEARRPVGEIAARPGRHRSTIHRELGRNRSRDGDRGFCGYFPLTARDLARRRRQRRRTLAADEGLRTHVTERPEAGWSPRQIAGGLRQEADGGAAACRETIYRHVYGPEGRGTASTATCPRPGGDAGAATAAGRAASPIPRERWIENRPAEVGARETFGHWEADLLIFRPWTPPAPQELSSSPAHRSRLPPSIRSRRPRAAGLDELRGPAPDRKDGLARPRKIAGSAGPGPTAHAILDYRPRSPWKPFRGGPSRPGLRPG